MPSREKSPKYLTYVHDADQNLLYFQLDVSKNGSGNSVAKRWFPRGRFNLQDISAPVSDIQTNASGQESFVGVYIEDLAKAFEAKRRLRAAEVLIGFAQECQEDPQRLDREAPRMFFPASIGKLATKEELDQKGNDQEII